MANIFNEQTQALPKLLFCLCRVRLLPTNDRLFRDLLSFILRLSGLGLPADGPFKGTPHLPQQPKQQFILRFRGEQCSLVIEAWDESQETVLSLGQTGCVTLHKSVTFFGPQSPGSFSDSK